MLAIMIIAQVIIGIAVILLFYINGVCTGLLLSRCSDFKDMWRTQKSAVIIQIALIIAVLVGVVIWILV